MAILERNGTRIRCHLLARHLVGRSSLAHLRLADPSVSAEHAVLSWNGREWEVHDLGSRNGTTLDGRRLGQGERTVLAGGAEIGFGSAARWRLADDAPPAVMALPVAGGEAVVGEHDLLALPAGEAPEVTVYRDGAGWVLDRDGAIERADSGVEVATAAGRFVVHLPDVVAPTMEADRKALALDAITLSFRVSRDEEHIALVARAGDRLVDLGARSHHALLLMLARARLEDQRLALPETSHGWLHLEELQRGLCLDESHLNVIIFRCRQQVAAAGIAGAAGIVERRKLARQLRVGVGRLEIAVD